ncbi:endonuclease/exonuclease/phosphatase family protein [Vannielia sp.]|uniref:endonuclease/exonuclease/phosphatase family protein n=1 Tax=Vannielia sp. TaxID=2813045 RepID=UPI00261C2140|nr:endonuclease/exonuclease/phosphatase family protein [Vannielia sp.]MDF1872142.1 endonuclease/exonuclease/phosphatase family protein [Vannielia sp.]
MTEWTVASFNVKNLIGAEQEYYRFEKYTLEEYAWKAGWLAEQVATLNADLIGFQEIFDIEALRDVIAQADEIGEASNAVSIPDGSKPYRRKAIFRKLAYQPYEKTVEIAFAPNANDGGPGERRPGVAVLSRRGFSEAPEIIQVLDNPLEIPLRELGGDGAGSFTVKRLSRPILKVKVPVAGTVVTVFNCHLKSKLGEFITPQGADFAPEANLTNYDAVGRAMGSLRAALRRMAEAWVLRREIVAELKKGHPVIVMGDLNDGEHAVSTEIITGEAPFKNYAWMRRHDARHPGDRYSVEQAAQITEAVDSMRLHSAEKLFVRKSLRHMVYTASFGGVFESIDQILLSRHFHPEAENPLAQMEYFSVLNDHLTDGSHPEAPYNKLASDHGQIMAHLRFGDSPA